MKIEWLLEGDPAIRWQVMRDLLDEPSEVWEEERLRTLEQGWVAELLSLAERDCFIGASLTAPSHYAWVVNGSEVA